MVFDSSKLCWDFSVMLIVEAHMLQDITITPPSAFGLSSFAELLATRAPIPGEELGSFEAFHEGMMRSLTPFTPYEAVVAENLIAIEWDLYQQRRMRDAGLRSDLRKAVEKAAMNVERARHEAALDAAWEAFVEEHGNDDDWKEPFKFDEAAAEQRSEDLASRAVSHDPDVQAAAHAEIVGMGLSPLDLMSDVDRVHSGTAKRHDAKVQELERRRREVKRDYDALQKARPVEAEVAQAEVIEG